MAGRYFEYLYIEICVAANRRISRFDLWRRVWEADEDPDALDRDAAAEFLADGLPSLLAEEGIRLAPRAERRLKRRIGRFDPRYPLPEEHLVRMFG